MKQVFDVYDIRARLAVVIFLVSPVLFSIYLQVESIRNIASTTVIAIILMALSNLLMVVIRYNGKYVYNKREIMVKYLLPTDTHIDSGVKERLYKFLGKVDESFTILFEKKDDPVTEDYYNTCKSALNWLKEHSRESSIVSKENASYGFCRNLLGAKKVGITVCLVILIIQVLQFWIQFSFNISNVTEEYALSFCMTTIYLFLWIFLVRKNIVEISAKCYAEALLLSFDKFIEASGIS